ncbi:MAG TPA: polysaccharide biosynthesis/export family protein [Sphingomicrobium sp.]|nr:polysaccharide biosynthesis/export family protein [Sphingomicrobium sp.]
MVRIELSRSRIFALVAAAAALFVGACSDSTGGPIPYNIALGNPDAPTVAPLGSDYRIAPMDTLSVKVFKSQDLTGDYQVDLTGHISLPLVGEVDAANLTTAQLDQRLTEKLGEKYFQNPDVSVGIKSSSRRSVTVDGAVKQAGTFPVGGPTSLMQAVALAGGTTEDANARRVAVFRSIGGQRQAAAFDLAAIRHGQSPDPQIYPGDIVVVDGSSVKTGFKKVLQTIPLLAIFGPL